MKSVFYSNISDLAPKSNLQETQMLKKTEDYIKREFVAGDEEALARLFNSAHSKLSGFVPRNSDYWRWACLTRPSVEEKGITIITRNNEIVCYAVVGKTGDIWELAYNQYLDRKIIVEKLISFALDYAFTVGANSVTLNEFAGDKTVQEVCNKLGFAEAPSEQVFISVMDFARLILSVLKDQEELDLEGTFLLIIRNCPTWCVNQFAIQINKTGISLLDKLENPEATVTIDIQIITSLVFGSKRPFRDALTFKVKVKPFWKIRKCLKMLGYLKADSSLFIPKADMG
jgi:hypothetical protein